MWRWKELAEASKVTSDSCAFEGRKQKLRRAREDAATTHYRPCREANNQACVWFTQISGCWSKKGERDWREKNRGCVVVCGKSVSLPFIFNFVATFTPPVSTRNESSKGYKSHRNVKTVQCWVFDGVKKKGFPTSPDAARGKLWVALLRENTCQWRHSYSLFDLWNIIDYNIYKYSIWLHY